MQQVNGNGQADADARWYGEPMGDRVSDGHRDGRTLTERAYWAISRQIATLELAPGAVFSERAMAEQLAFGKAPVREALQRLTLARMVTPRAGSGYRVAPITLRDTRDLFGFWRLLEGEAVAHIEGAELAAQALRTLAHMGVAGQQPAAGGFTMRWLVGRDLLDAPFDEFYSEVFFHFTAIGLGRNGRVSTAFYELMTDVERVLRLAASLGAQIRDEHGHDEVVDALGRGDRQRAGDAAVAHLVELEERVVDALLAGSVAQEVNLARPSPGG